jgi:polysaccharide pyruvyl transferase WcaK-like protein
MENKMNDILLISFFNSPNLGDLLISNCLYDEIISHGLKIKKISYTGDPFKFSDINNLKISAKRIKHTAIRHIINVFIISRILKREIMANRKLAKIKNAIKSSKVVVFGGGNLLFDLNKHTDSSNFFNKIVKYSKKNKKKIFVLAIGIGPFCTIKQQKKAIKSLENCDYVSFRDSISYEIYKKNSTIDNFYMSEDPVLRTTFMTRKAMKFNTIALNFVDTQFCKNAKKAEEFNIKLMKSLLVNTSYDYYLFSTDLVDYDYLYKLHSKINDTRIKVFIIKGLDSLIELYNKIDMIIAMRMHTLITGYTSELPIIALEWQHKVKGFMEKIDKIDSLHQLSDKSINSIIEEVKKKHEQNYNLLSEKKNNPDIENLLAAIKVS